MADRTEFPGDWAKLPTSTNQSPPSRSSSLMNNVSVNRQIFCNMYVVITPFVERQLDPCLEDTEEEEMERRHKITKVNRKNPANFTFMKQHF